MSKADSKIMRPIRNVDYDHWSYTIDDTYDSRKSSMKSEMIDEIDVISEDNYPKFKSKLKLDDKMIKINTLYREYHDFITNKNMIEQKKKNDLDRAVDEMHDTLIKWNKERKWKTDVERSLISNPADHDRMLKSLCREETEKQYYAGPKGKSLQLLEISKKKAKHILNSGLPLDIAVKSIGTEMATQKINLDLPKDMFNPALAIENK